MEVALVLLQTLLIALKASAIAPDDAHTFCTESSHCAAPVHPPNYRILLDSFNYLNLLPPHDGAVWQQVDNDMNNIPGRGTAVS